jgi:outer membrane protein OmpA-like peptidoglycan-associated protein
MYIRTHERILAHDGLSQAELPSIDGTPCLQDDVRSRLEFARLSDSITKTLDDFPFGEPTLKKTHKTWIRRQLVPAIVASWRTSKPIRTIILLGDADEVGQPSFNYKLGKARADAVSKELTKEIEDQSRGLSSKITIEVYSRGECWPVVKSGKKEKRNRRVDVFALKAEPAKVKPTSPPTPPGKPDFSLLPEETRERIEEHDRETRERNRFRFDDPIAPHPRGKSLSDWLG